MTDSKCMLDWCKSNLKKTGKHTVTCAAYCDFHCKVFHLTLSTNKIVNRKLEKYYARR